MMGDELMIVENHTNMDVIIPTVMKRKWAQKNEVNC
jgi:hypothetical protein